MASLTVESRAPRACPRYSAWAATSPAWFTRISRIDSRRSDSFKADSSPGAVGAARAVCTGLANTLIALSISPSTRSARLNMRVFMHTLYNRVLPARGAGKGAPGYVHFRAFRNRPYTSEYFHVHRIFQA